MRIASQVARLVNNRIIPSPEEVNACAMMGNTSNGYTMLAIRTIPKPLRSARNARHGTARCQTCAVSSELHGLSADTLYSSIFRQELVPPSGDRTEPNLDFSRPYSSQSIF